MKKLQSNKLKNGERIILLHAFTFFLEQIVIRLCISWEYYTFLQKKKKVTENEC